MIKEDIILEIKKTIKQLSVDPKEADTIKALWKQIFNMSDCKHAKDTGNPVKTSGCKTCGNPTWIECGSDKVVGDRVSSNVCKTCKHFESVKPLNNIIGEQSMKLQ